MLKNIYNLLRAFVTGEEYDAVFEFEINFVDVVFILIFLGLLIYALFSWV